MVFAFNQPLSEIDAVVKLFGVVLPILAEDDALAPALTNFIQRLEWYPNLNGQKEPLNLTRLSCKQVEKIIASTSGLLGALSQLTAAIMTEEFTHYATEVYVYN